MKIEWFLRAMSNPMDTERKLNVRMYISLTYVQFTSGDQGGLLAIP